MALSLPPAVNGLRSPGWLRAVVGEGLIASIADLCKGPRVRPMVDETASEQQERELQDARDRGRWLSDDEQAAVDARRLQDQLAEDEQRHLRQRLVVFTLVCILLPPLWPLAFVLSLYLLFPRTAARIGLVAAVVLVTAALAATVLIVICIQWLMSLLG